VTLASKEQPGITISGSDLPCRDEDNAVYIVIQHLLNLYRLPDVGLHVTLEKGLQVGTGMGSSAASAVAAAKALQAFLNLSHGIDVTENELAEACLVSERRISGGSTGDNLLPALVGGLVLIMTGKDLHYKKIAVPPGLTFVMVKPPVTVITREARAQLPTSVPISEMIKVASHTARLFSSLAEGDFAGFADSVVQNEIQTCREHNIPHYDEAKAAALEAGAICFGVSGSGPSVFAGVLGCSKVAMTVAAAITEKFGSGCLTYFTRPDNEGARVELLKLEG